MGEWSLTAATSLLFQTWGGLLFTASLPVSGLEGTAECNLSGLYDVLFELGELGIV
jgi:hypothetical protein